MDKKVPDNSRIDSIEYQEFIGILQLNKRRLFGFILAAIPHYSTAEDVMQDTIIRLWSKYSTYTPGTNFSAWAISYARYVILEYQSKKRLSCVRFDSRALENLSEPFEMDDDIDNRIEALRSCLEKMPEVHKRIIQMRYSENLAVKEIALRIGRPIHGMYKAVVKIHGLLQDCVERALKRWEVI